MRTLPLFLLPLLTCLACSSSDPGSGSGSGSGSKGSGTSGGSSTTSGGANSGGGANSSSDPAQACVDAVNAYRATVGLPAYARWNAEETCVDGQAQSDSEANQAHSAFTQCGEWAQNECPGWPGPSGSMIGDCLKAMWAEGPGGGHYDNMTSKSYTKVACGFYTLSDGSVWATQDFK
ncbi:MAG TPA: CAP domain-containing protein [Polyangiaceae bacterium]